MDDSTNGSMKPVISRFHGFNSDFSREIRFALAVKFLLLAVLWWLFFAGKKQQVDEELVADKVLGSAFSAISSSHYQESSK